MHENVILAVSHHVCAFLSKEEFIEYTSLLGFSDSDWKTAHDILKLSNNRKNIANRILDIFETCSKTAEANFACIPSSALGALPPLGPDSVRLALKLKSLYALASHQTLQHINASLESLTIARTADAVEQKVPIQTHTHNQLRIRLHRVFSE